MVLTILEVLAAAVCCALAARRDIHMLQLESYQLPGYRRWLARNREYLLKHDVSIGLIATVAGWYLPVILSMIISVESTRNACSRWIVLTLFVFAAAMQVSAEAKQPQKKPLVYTRRVIRLYVVLGTVCLLCSIALKLLGVPTYLLYALPSYLVMLCAKIAEPMENHINHGFFTAAQKRLAECPDLIKIGITGSYGKTSTKFALREILSQKYRVLASPASFNTPMGLSRVINEQLRAEHQVFIAEMGARHKGDIRELCQLVHPKYGMLTSVGPQHLETFGSIDNIASTKYELIDALPDDGEAFFASDGAYVDRLFALCGKKKFRTGGDADRKSYMWVDKLEMNQRGSQFTLMCADGGEIRCRTKLLGRHNIQNITLAAAVARRLGLSMEEIAIGITKIQPVEHRLQLIRGALTVIDDAFNSNPSGCQEALQVLSGFPGRRIVVTPGMVEQGEREEELNYAFGTQMKGFADIAILVGPKHTLPIFRGMSDSGFAMGNVHVVKDLNEATTLLGQLGGAGDTVLFENDLPDNYSE